MVVDIEARMRPVSILKWEYRVAMYWWPVDWPVSRAEILWKRVQ